MRVLGILVFLGINGACAHHVDTWQARTCHEEGAYSLGHADAEEGDAMDSRRILTECGPKQSAAIAQAYRHGYRNGARMTEREDEALRAGIRRAQSTDATIPTEMLAKSPARSRTAAGLASAGDDVRALVTPRQCLQHKGEQICGIHCVRAYGRAECTQNRSHRCIAAFGEIVCGRECVADAGIIRCELDP